MRDPGDEGVDAQAPAGGEAAQDDGRHGRTVHDDGRGDRAAQDDAAVQGERAYDLFQTGRRFLAVAMAPGNADYRRALDDCLAAAG
jgi:hypothetical protein